MEVVVLMFTGRSFHNLGAATGQFMTFGFKVVLSLRLT